jgi:uncharacterized protein YbaR (Trm112 family)
MSLDPRLLEILACPVCHEPVRLQEDGSALRCEKCRRVYPVVDDIPVMLVEEARIEESSRKPV